MSTNRVAIVVDVEDGAVVSELYEPLVTFEEGTAEADTFSVG